MKSKDKIIISAISGLVLGVGMTVAAMFGVAVHQQDQVSAQAQSRCVQYKVARDKLAANGQVLRHIGVVTGNKVAVLAFINEQGAWTLAVMDARTKRTCWFMVGGSWSDLLPREK